MCSCVASYGFIVVVADLQFEMLRLWEETCPSHEIDYCMDDVYSNIGVEVVIN